MSYVYKRPRGMGLAELGTRCTQVSGGTRVCASDAESAQMRTRGCHRIGVSDCDPRTGPAGEMVMGVEWCCPPAAAAERPGEESILDEILVSVGLKQPTTPTGPTAAGRPPREETPGEPSAGKFAQYAGEVAQTEAAAAEMDTLPIEEGEPAGLQRYMPHIMIASTAVGLLTFVGWVVLRKKD